MLLVGTAIHSRRRDESQGGVTARLLAIAFHEAVSVEKLAAVFRSEINQLFGGTTAAHCPSCRRQFAVFFPQSDDPENVKYLA
jgi:hypothetical protein